MQTYLGKINKFHPFSKRFGNGNKICGLGERLPLLVKEGLRDSNFVFEK